MFESFAKMKRLFLQQCYVARCEMVEKTRLQRTAADAGEIVAHGPGYHAFRLNRSVLWKAKPSLLAAKAIELGRREAGCRDT